ncbi:MAG: ABC transporter permease [Acidobacteria bacterium]|nr:ABC transporter permease [Acidobacteriota bacterium]
MRIRTLWTRRVLDRDLNDELAFHLAKRTDKNRCAGMDPTEARYAAHRQLGNATQIKEHATRLRTFAAFEDVLQDLHYGARMLRKSPGFALIAIATLALGIGVNTAIFSVVKAVLLDSLPYRQPNRIVTMARGDADNPNPTKVSFGEVHDWKSRQLSFDQIAMYRGWTPAATGNGTPRMVFGIRVTQNFFDTLGVAPRFGRNFTTDEDRPSGWHVVVLSYPYWVRQFGADERAIGKTIVLDQVPFEIVGILPSNFQPLSFTDAGSPPDVWAPLGYDMSQSFACRTCQHLQAVARLRDGVALSQARAEMTTTASQLVREFPNDYPEHEHILIQSLRDTWYGQVQTTLWLLLAATSVVLLIACTNVASLLLARLAQKNPEVALRSALGAGRARIVRQLLTESVLLSSLGGIAGVLHAIWGTRLLAQWAPPQIPRVADIHVDTGVLLFALLVSTVTGIVMGLAPSLQASRIDHRLALQRAARGVTGGQSKFRTVLVASQICLAFLLTVASGLLLKSFVRAWSVDPGISAHNLYETNFSLTGKEYEDDKVTVAAQTEILERVRHLPGVESVSLTSTPPLAGNFGGFDRTGFIIQDRRLPNPEVPSVDRYIVSPDYFATVRIPLLRGRYFTRADAESPAQVAIISERTAREIFPHEEPLGRRIQLGGRHDDKPWAEIIGIVGDIHQYGLDTPTTPQVYLLYTQLPFSYPGVLLIRSSVAPSALTPAINEQIWSLDKNTLIFNPILMEQLLSDSLAQRRFTMSLLSGFGVVALVLAAIGIYGVLSCTVAQRTSEIGVRMALGARRSDVGRMVLREALRITLLAISVGCGISLLVTRAMRGLLFEVSPSDPATLAMVAAGLLVVTAFSAFLPAWRATSIEPTLAMRHE